VLHLLLLPRVPHRVQHRLNTLLHSQPFLKLKYLHVRTNDLARARPICVSSVKRPVPSQVVRPPVLAWRSATSSQDLPSSGSPDQVDACILSYDKQCPTEGTPVEGRHA
jgi:hypothetical protein